MSMNFLSRLLVTYAVNITYMLHYDSIVVTVHVSMYLYLCRRRKLVLSLDRLFLHSSTFTVLDLFIEI